jgi:NDP-sugar pyrophosphorylase family protein
MPTTALVLAGGKGERLRPLTDDRPKPMVEVAGAPILVHHLRWLRDNGITRVVLLTGYLHEVIHDYFKGPRIDGLTVDCVAEETPLGRGGAFRNGFEQAGITDDLVVATNGDVITDQAIRPMFNLHRSRSAAVTLLVVQMVSPYGIVDVDDDGGVVGFVEKPPLPYWINGGVYLLDSSVVRQFPVVGDHETTTFPELVKQGRVAATRCVGFWNSVESPKDLREAGEKLAGAG